MEKDPIRITYEKLERNTLILIACSIPFFAVVYLYSQSESITRTSYNLPEIADFILLGLIYALLAFHYWKFHNSIKNILNNNHDLETKILLYQQATISRFWTLLLSSVLCPLGLLLFYRATNDIGLINMDVIMDPIHKFVNKLFSNSKKDKNDT